MIMFEELTAFKVLIYFIFAERKYKHTVTSHITMMSYVTAILVLLIHQCLFCQYMFYTKS